MQGTLDGFSYGLVTPVAAFVMACLGSALGLRCTARSVHGEGSFKPGWLALGATSIGSGIWTMHFIAMMGFTVSEVPITYDRTITFTSLVVAIVMVGVGIFIVGYRGATVLSLLTGGTITGLGVACMHYLGMAGMRMQGDILYSTPVVVLSVVVAVVAATAALWAAVSIHGFMASLGASLVMGVAVTGMHYTGMVAVSVHLHGAAGSAGSGESPASLLAPMLLGPIVFLLIAGVVVMFDPQLVMGEPDWKTSGRKAQDKPGSSSERVNPSLFGQAPDAWRATGFQPGRRVAPGADPIQLPPTASARSAPRSGALGSADQDFPAAGGAARPAPWPPARPARGDDWPTPHMTRAAQAPQAAQSAPPASWQAGGHPHTMDRPSSEAARTSAPTPPSGPQSQSTPAAPPVMDRPPTSAAPLSEAEPATSWTPTTQHGESHQRDAW